MAYKRSNDILSRMASTLESVLRANGWEIVTHDKALFPYVEPALAAIKSRRLLVFALKVFRAESQFLRPEELIHIRNDLREFGDVNTPESDPRVSEVWKVAFVMAPEEITVAAPVGDIKWIVVQNEDQIPDELVQKLSL